MKLRHFLLGKFTAVDKRLSQKFHDFKILALHPAESKDFYESLEKQVTRLVRALKPPNRDVLRLVIPREANEWLYIRVFPGTPHDHIPREVTRYHAILLKEQDLCALEWRPWRLDPFLFTGIAADKVEGAPGGNAIKMEDIPLPFKPVPVEIDVDLRTLGEENARVVFSDELIDQIRTNLNEGPVYITEQDDPAALMELIGEVVNRQYGPDTKDRMPLLALGLRRVPEKKDITEYYQSLLPPNANRNYTALATVERGSDSDRFPIEGWTKMPLPTIENEQDKPSEEKKPAEMPMPSYDQGTTELRERVSQLESSIREWRELGPDPYFVRNRIEDLEAARAHAESQLNKEAEQTSVLEQLRRSVWDKEKELKLWKQLGKSPQAVAEEVNELRDSISELRDRSLRPNDNGLAPVPPSRLSTGTLVTSQSREVLWKKYLLNSFILVTVLLVGIGIGAELAAGPSDGVTPPNPNETERIEKLEQDLKALQQTNHQKDLESVDLKRQRDECEEKRAQKKNNIQKK